MKPKTQSRSVRSIWLSLILSLARGLTAVAVAVVVVGLSSSVRAQPVCVPPPAGLIGWWRGENNALDTANGNHGTLQGGLGFAAAKVGQGFSFDGVDDCLSFPGFAFGNLATFGVWIKTTQTGGVIVDGGEGTLQYQSWRLSLDAQGRPRLDHARNGVDGYVSINGPSPINDGLFHHLVTTTDQVQKKLTLFVDGVEVVSYTEMDPNFTSWAGAETGAQKLGKGDANGLPSVPLFAGILDEPELYDRPLTASEIAAIYQAGSAGKCVSTCAPPPANLVAWWRGEANALDAMNANNGTAFGTVTAAAGMVGQAWQFDDPADYLQFPDGPANFRTADFSIEFWFKTTSTQLGHLFTKRSSSCGYGNFIEVRLSEDGRLWFDLDEGAADTWTTIHSASALNDGLFHHVAAVRNGIEMRLFIDGALAASINCPHVLDINNAEPLRVGKSPCGSYSGLLDELSIYERALTSTEVGALYAAGSAGKCTGPLGIGPTAANVFTGGTIAFTASGGQPSYTFTLAVNNSGGSITTDGHYTAGSTVGTDTVQVTDSLGGNAVATVTVYVPTCTPSPSDIVARWRGEGDATDLEGVNHGTLQNGATFASGLVGTAFSFDGVDDEVNIPSNSLLSPWTGGEMTLEAWVYLRDWPAPDPFTGQSQRTIAAKAGSGGYEFRIGVSTGGVVGFNSWQELGANHAFAGGGLVEPGRWHHVAGVLKEGQFLRVYIDGLQVAESTSFLGSMTATASPFHIGHRGDGQHLNGLVDEVTLYNRALPTSEIAAIYNAGSAGKCISSPPPTITCPGNITQQTTDPSGLNVNFSIDVSGQNTPILTVCTSPSVQGNISSGFHFPVGTTTVNCTATDSAQQTTMCSFTVTVNYSGEPCPPPAGAVAWWQGEDNANDSVALNHGTLQAGASYVPAKIGKGIQTTGNSLAMTASDSPDLRPAHVSVEMWVKATTPGTQPAHVYQLSKSYSFSSGSYALKSPESGGLAFYVTLASGYVYSPEAGPGIWDANFHHVVGTYDGLMVRLYVDGTQVGTGTQAPGAIQYGNTFESGELFLGGVYRNVGQFFFNGTLDDVTIYSRALAAAEIQTLFNAGAAGKCGVPQPPTITCPANITEQTTSAAGKTVTFAPTASPNGAVTVVCVPASGSLFPVGTTPVNCSATDAANRTATCSFTVTVDYSPPGNPTITCPANIAQEATDPTGKSVSFSVSAIGQNVPITVACTPASGSVFPVGTTPVNCTATDAANQTATCSFTVTVNYSPVATCPPPGAIAWYQAEGDAQDSVGDHDGELAGEAPFFAVGHSGGQAFRVRSSDQIGTSARYVYVPGLDPVTALDFSGSSFTWETWAYPSWVDGNPILIEQGGEFSSPPYNGLRLRLLQDAPFSASASISGYIDSPSPSVTSDQGAVRAGQWNHIVFVLDHANNQARLYANGALVGSEVETRTATDSFMKDLNIGGPLYNPNLGLNGFLDDVVFYKRALTHTEVRARYNCGQNIPCPPPSNGLASWWRGENNALDQLENNDGTPNVIMYEAGRNGQAFRFNGASSYIRAQRQIENGFTLAAWMKSSVPSRTGSQFWQGDGFIYSDLPGAHYDFGTAVLNGKFAFGIGQPDQTIQSITTVNSGDWVHVAAVRSGTFIKVYVNGVEEATRDTGISAPLNAQPLLFLGGNVNDSRFYNGLMDEVLVYSRALTAGEILGLYQCSTPVGPTITCPGNILEQTTDPAGKAVTFATPAASSPNGVATVICNPVSGSVFPIGTTTVNCSATDTANQTATCSFIVTVNYTGPAPVVFFDGAFDDNGWELIVLSMNNPGTVVASRVAAGGNPGAYRRAMNTVGNGTATDPSRVVGFHRKIGATYQPQSQGAFATIDYSEDSLLEEGGGNGQRTGPALRQGGNVYIHLSLLTPETVWTHKTRNDLRAEDFVLVDPSATTDTGFFDATRHPDFSASGGLIEIGFYRANSAAAGGNGYSTTASIDNWSMALLPAALTIHPSSISVAPNGTVNFSATGGSGTLTYSFVQNNSGATINASTGEYHAGNQCGVTDTLRVTDEASHTADATVTIVDTVAPVISACAPAQTVSVGISCKTALPDLTSQVTATDNCGSASITQTPAGGTLLPPGAHTVILRATDAAGNFSICEVTVTIRDTAPPVIEACVPAQVLAAGDNCQAALPNLLSTIHVTDNCGVQTLTQTPAPGTMLGVGSHMITLRFEDAAGNAATCERVLTVEDTQPPAIISCAPNVPMELRDHPSNPVLCQKWIPDVTALVVAADNCSPVSISQTPAAGTLNSQGVKTVVVTVSDADGNTSTCNTTLRDDPPTFRWFGKVRRSDGSPVAGQRVTLSLPPRGSRSATTDGNGAYSFPDAPQNSMVALVPIEGVYASSVNGDVITFPTVGERICKDREVNFIVNFRVRVGGRIVDSRGLGMVGWTVHIASDDSPSVSLDATTDSTGNYLSSEINIAAGQTLRVTPTAVSGFDFTPVSRTITVGPDRLYSADFTAAPRVSNPTFGLPTDRIAFAAVGITRVPPSLSYPNGRTLYFDNGTAVMNGDGTGYHWLGPAGQKHRSHAFSPDGTKIAYVIAWDGGGSQRVIANADGSERRYLHGYPWVADSISWSPDGSRVAFVESYSFNTTQLDTFTPEGDPEIGSSWTPSRFTVADQFSWSPDGSKFAITSHSELNVPSRLIGYSGILDIHQFGRSLGPLTPCLHNPVSGSAIVQSHPSWSPDGRFLALDDSLGSGIYVFDTVAQSSRRLLPYGTLSHPTWSPDGNYIAYRDRRSAAHDRHVMVSRADGSEVFDLGLGDVSSHSWGRRLSRPTPLGQNVEVEVGSATLNLSSVTSAGETRVDSLSPSTLPMPSGFFSVGGIAAYEISTTATVEGPITVCFQVPASITAAQFARLRILHGERNLLGQLVMRDRTILAPDSPAPSFSQRTICARVTSLSPFAVAEMIETNLAQVSGLVMTTNGQPLAAVSLQIASDFETNTVETLSDGTFNIPNLDTNTTYSLTPRLAGFAFSPPQVTLTELTGESTVQFYASELPPTLVPPLSFARDERFGGLPAVSWPGNPFNVLLESSDSINGTNWSSVLELPFPIGDGAVVPIVPGEPQRFFRLRRP